MPTSDSEKRQAVERKIVRHLIRTLKAHGWVAIYVDDGGDEAVTTHTEGEVMDAVFSVDQATIAFRKPITPKGGKTHYVVVALGNGVDCIADYTYSEISDGFEELMEQEGEWVTTLPEYD